MYFLIKRTFDILISAVAIILLIPLFLVIALAIIITSGFPVFYLQERMGQNWKTFRIMKFRTMVNNAEKLGSDISSFNDSRVTSVGRFLRKNKLDELPQVINVLLGDMTLVGPRPELPRYVKFFENDYKFILQVKPGITDFASIKFKNESELLKDDTNIELDYMEKILPVKISLAKKYIREANFSTDIKILFSTFRAILC